MSLRWEREWLDLVADLMDSPLTGRTGLLVDTFDTPAGSCCSRSGGGPILMRQWPPEHFAEFRDEMARFTVRDMIELEQAGDIARPSASSRRRSDPGG
ncbi:MAG: hypothetical protein L0I24_03915 [Pseudonocardia sp.]|nr:hypothetical protein [Actinomycetes bacterium]MDN5930199.1 hypothetical protein [Pseudonocardia sp.]